MTTKIESLKRRVIGRAVRQFGRPRGVAGRLAGLLMAHRRANRLRNRWAVSLLDVRPEDRVLEIGFGPGIAIAELARRVSRGHVHGIDHSELMVRRATRRNRAAIRSGRVALVHARVDRLPDFDGPLDAILAVNTLGFWAEPAQRLEDLRRVLRPGGRIALVAQPRVPGADRGTTDRAAGALRDLLTGAGFTGVRHEILELEPPVACVLAERPAEGSR